MTLEAGVDDTVALLEDVIGGAADLLGQRNGAFIAMLTAMRRPELVRRLVPVSGGFRRDGLVFSADEGDPQQMVAEFGPSYGEVSPEGEEHFPVIVDQTAELERKQPALAQAALRDIKAPTLLMFGDDDRAHQGNLRGDPRRRAVTVRCAVGSSACLLPDSRCQNVGGLEVDDATESRTFHRSM
jgi:pimeloyl-ACP methyl ester carboxylesterase